MDLRLEKQHAVIVGGARGIGWAIAEEFAQEGADVTIVDLSPQVSERASELAASARDEGQRWRGFQADVTQPSQVEAVFEQLRLDQPPQHVVIAAGIGSGKFGFPFTNLSPSDWPKVVDVNLMGTVNVAHAVAGDLRACGDGSLTLISSVAGQIGSQTDPPYSAAKAAVINFGQCMAKDLAAYGVRVNTICPGMIKTELNESVWKAWHDAQAPEDRLDYETWAGSKVRSVVPLQRWQTPQDIAALAVFLASPRGRNITGQTMNVDGGFVMHW
ncbi:MAG: SDR family oxidoreductase [Planctomycetales bacterium]|nr:SDR family oxidoreductase [Planctomycetales bacterium]